MIENNLTKEQMQETMREMLQSAATPELMERLDNLGYFEAPAAKSHHGNYPGGLFAHSVNVAQELRKMTDTMELEWERKESPEVIGLLHDVCKCEDYRLIGEEDGKPIYEFIKVPGSSYEGHGCRSILLLCPYFEFTAQEVLCIYHHMGSFTPAEQWAYYSKAVRIDRNVALVHAADNISANNTEVN